MVKCFILLGTGNPRLKPINDGVLPLLSKTMVEIVTETEKTAKNFVEDYSTRTVTSALTWRRGFRMWAWPST